MATEVVLLQAVAIVDHVCVSEDAASLRALVDGEIGGSQRVDMAEIQRLLSNVGEYLSKAGGSAANTARCYPTAPKALANVLGSPFPFATVYGIIS
jgi:hypothetical protein